MLPVNPRAEPDQTVDALGCDRLVEAARCGDEDAFRRLYRGVQPRLLRYLRTLVGDEAEDVAADTWLEIARRGRGVDGDLGAFRGWAATVGRRRALDHLRRLRRRPSLAVPVDELPEVAAAEDTAGGALDAMSTGAALALIATLPRDQAEAVMLRVVVG